MSRSKVKKFTKIRWDISWRMRFVRKSEDEQLKYMVEVCEQSREIQEILESFNQVQTWTST